MNGRELVALVDRLRALPAETEWLEFKRNRHDPQELGEYVSALANTACLTNQPRGYLLFGIDDATQAVVGTRFDPYATKGRGHQDLLPWLAAGLRPNTGFEVHIVEHPKGRVVLFEVGPAKGEPVAFYGTAHVRVGASKTELRNHPEKARALWTRGSDWSAEVCEAASLDDLESDAVATAREQFVVKHPGQALAIAGWDDATFEQGQRPEAGAVTNAALLLLGRPESKTLLSPAVANISWILTRNPRMGKQRNRPQAAVEGPLGNAHSANKYPSGHGLCPLFTPRGDGFFSKGFSKEPSKGAPVTRLEAAPVQYRGGCSVRRRIAG